MAVTGLADGFLAGFNTMNNYYRGQKADERADREAGLRDAMWQNTLEQQQKQDARYADELKYGRERDAKNDERQAKIDALNEKSTLANINSAYASSRRADRQLALQEQQYKLQREQEDRARFQQENQALFQTGYQALANGEEPPAAFWQAAQDPRAGQYNPTRYISSEYADAGKTFVQSTGALMRDAQEGKLNWNSKEGIERINSPAIIKSAGVLYQDEIKAGIGGIDQATGKVIKNKELDKVMVTPDGYGFVLGLKVTYDDGSTAKHPVTVNRSTDPNDPAKVIPLSEFLGTGYKRAALSKQMQERAAQVSQALGLSEGPDNKGYRSEVTKINSQWAKEAIKIERNDDLLPPKELQAAKERNDAWREKTIDKIGEVYGLGSKAGSSGNEDTGNSGQSSLIKWRGQDRLKAAFIEDAAVNGSLGVIVNENDSPEVLDQLFEKWKTFTNQAASSRVADELRSSGDMVTDKTQTTQKGRPGIRTPEERDAYRTEQEALARKSGEAYRRNVSSSVPGMSPREAANNAINGGMGSRMTSEQLMQMRKQQEEDEATRRAAQRGKVSSFVPGGVAELETLAKGPFGFKN